MQKEKKFSINNFSRTFCKPLQFGEIIIRLCDFGSPTATMHISQNQNFCFIIGFNTVR